MRLRLRYWRGSLHPEFGLSYAAVGYKAGDVVCFHNRTDSSIPEMNQKDIETLKQNDNRLSGERPATVR
jgi:hypothetical protein